MDSAASDGSQWLRKKSPVAGGLPVPPTVREEPDLVSEGELLVPGIPRPATTPGSSIMEDPSSSSMSEGNKEELRPTTSAPAPLVPVKEVLRQSATIMPRMVAVEAQKAVFEVAPGRNRMMVAHDMTLFSFSIEPSSS